MSDVRHFPTGMYLRQVGDTRICGRKKSLVDFLERMVTDIQNSGGEDITATGGETQCDEPDVD